MRLQRQRTPWRSDARQKFPASGLLLLLVLAGLLAADAGFAASMRCSDGIVNRGDSAAQLRRRCGEPDHIASWPASPPLAAGAVWFYNDGPSRLLRVLRLRAGRLVAVQSEGYGFRAPERPVCTPDAARRGWSAYRLLALCGAPDAREVVGTLLTARRDGPTSRLLLEGQRAVHRQRWRYDFGPRHLPREYTLDNAIVTEVRTLPRGD